MLPNVQKLTRFGAQSALRSYSHTSCGRFLSVTKSRSGWMDDKEECFCDAGAYFGVRDC